MTLFLSCFQAEVNYITGGEALLPKIFTAVKKIKKKIKNLKAWVDSMSPMRRRSNEGDFLCARLPRMMALVRQLAPPRLKKILKFDCLDRLKII